MSVRNATFRQLRVFVEVARHLSFARAAESLHLTPPAVTMQIKELEGHVGLPLFERQGRRVALTTAGEYLLVYARKVLATLKDAEDVAARLQRLETGTLTIGMLGTAQYFLPALLAEFTREHPGLDVRLVLGNREQLVQMLRNADVDIAVMGRPPSELNVRAEPFGAHPHVFVAPTDHPLLRIGHPTVQSLLPYGFIVREHGSGTRALFQAFFERHHEEPRIAMVLASNEAIKQAVMAGLGLGLLSLHTLQLELEHGLIARLDVEGTPIVRAWHVVHTLAKLLSPAAEAFRYFVLERGEGFLAERYGALLPLPSSP
ncbi:LysR substrate-binding domain-containing protein [Tepidimonas charontis]|uniref:HTH-type transcriptional activator CmpR n=1 Tax=Tepidimonas charontis TaxID=2267262 RepID=A0A554X061_9BURK|nr:LysR substrate-binding domain-containing protein [Tepidimonas charontis]TSE29231.1 HTH-type transcriptional activator CmpR [Tepidimonas charontis]